LRRDGVSAMHASLSLRVLFTTTYSINYPAAAPARPLAGGRPPILLVPRVQLLR